jgi:hypothetical protein
VNQTAIFWPMLAQVLLVYIVYAVLMRRRGAAIKSREARIGQFKDRSAEPAGSVSVSNNLINQFELPVLFHVACLASYVTTGVSYWVLVLAWIFVLSRYVHAWVHMTVNAVPYRTTAFAVGALALALMWISFAFHLAGA